MSDCIDEIHDFWFGELNEAGLCAPQQNQLWFSADAAVDETLRDRFKLWLERAAAGELASWTNTDRGLVALVVLLDQFSRNMHRGAAQAFAADPDALALAKEAISSGRHLRLPAIHRVFLYLPLEHSEDLAVQEQCVTLFEELANTTGDSQIDGFARYAVAHHDVIVRFGRFPHRNAILGRQSSADELTYLEQHGGF